MKVILTLAIMLIAQLSSAMVPDGTYQGVGTWETRDAAGQVLASGPLYNTWVQNGSIASNLGILKVGSTVVATFQDDYKYDVVTTSPSVYELSRLISGTYVKVGIFHEMGASYQADFNQASAQAIESGNVVGSNLLRIGHLRNADGSITYYRVLVVKQ